MVQLLNGYLHLRIRQNVAHVPIRRLLLYNINMRVFISVCSEHANRWGRVRKYAVTFV